MPSSELLKLVSKPTYLMLEEKTERVARQTLLTHNYQEKLTDAMNGAQRALRKLCVSLS